MSASDLIEIVIAAALLVLTYLWLRPLESFARRFAERTRACMILLAILPIALRFALIAHHPIPTPDIYDEFGHLLVADTLRHWRLANPAHPLHQFFETLFVLQSPTYSSIYPIGQGLMLAIGRAIFNDPWAGVSLSTAALCSLSYWMLRGWIAPIWALAGGLLAVIQFGPLNQWMNSYWGGSFAAAGGCLVFGALPRLRDRGDWRSSALLGLGLATNILTRPYESIFLLAASCLYLWRTDSSVPRRDSSRRLFALALIPIFFAIAVTLLQNKRVTGNWTTLPYQLSQQQYGVPAALTFQPDPIPHSQLTREQQLEYKSQLAFKGAGRETFKNFLLRLEYRVRFYRFFFLPPLFVALIFFALTLNQPRSQFIALTLLLFALGINFFPAFQFHYLAAVTCLFLLASIIGLERLNRFSPEAARLLLFLCFVHFGFWYTVHFFDDKPFALALRPYETWDGLNHSNPARRIAVSQQLEKIPGKLLVFVHYSPNHIFQDEWVYNAADIDRARIVWARDLGADENQKLLAYYPARTALLLEPDQPAPELSNYP